MIRVVVLLGLAAVCYTQSNTPCGVPTVQPVTKRIVGGTVAKPGAWPWTVLLADSLGFISGTGAIVNPNVLITSAQHFEGQNYHPRGAVDDPMHCCPRPKAEGNSASDHPQHRGGDSFDCCTESPGYTLYDLDIRYWRVYAGEYNISVDDPNEAYYRIKRVVLHPGYNSTSLENDIAVVIMSKPIAYNDNTRPACLPDSSHVYTVGETCYLPGWGSTSSTGNEEVMNQVAMPILADSVCQTHWQDFLPNTEVCAGYESGGKDFCSDDIGSPLMCKDQSGAWYIQGLASSGGDCTKADEPGVFEDVSQYSDWIKQTMRDANYPYQY